MKKGISNVNEELKQRLQAKANKLNRYELNRSNIQMRLKQGLSTASG